MTDIHETLQLILRETFDEPDLVMTDDMTATDVDKWDSLNHIQLVITVEKQFGVKFKNAEIARLQNIADFKKLIAKHLS